MMENVKVKGAKGINFYINGQHISEDSVTVLRNDSMVRRMIKDGDLIKVTTEKKKKKKGGE